MKKVSLFLLALTLSFSVMAGSVYAASDSKLEVNVDKLIGTKYKYAGVTPKGFDCSGFTMYVFNLFDIELDHSSRAQAKKGITVAKANLRAGDLVFFDTGGSGISHVGIYLGEGVFVHSSSNKGVIRNRLSETYYANSYVTAKRILSDEQYEQIAVND